MIIDNVNQKVRKFLLTSEIFNRIDDVEIDIETTN